jgi:hypothetical protein
VPWVFLSGWKGVEGCECWSYEGQWRQGVTTNDQGRTQCYRIPDDGSCTCTKRGDNLPNQTFNKARQGVALVLRWDDILIELLILDDSERVIERSGSGIELWDCTCKTHLPTKSQRTEMSRPQGI